MSTIRHLCDCSRCDQERLSKPGYIIWSKRWYKDSIEQWIFDNDKDRQWKQEHLIRNNPYIMPEHCEHGEYTDECKPCYSMHLYNEYERRRGGAELNLSDYNALMKVRNDQFLSGETTIEFEIWSINEKNKEELDFLSDINKWHRNTRPWKYTRKQPII